MTDAASTCRALQSATTTQDVTSIVRTYLAGLGMDKAAILPGTLLALGIDHAQEIAAAALEVARREVQATDSDAVVLKEVGTVLSTAAMRLVVLAAGVEAEPETL